RWRYASQRGHLWVKTPSVTTKLRCPVPINYLTYLHEIQQPPIGDQRNARLGNPIRFSPYLYRARHCIERFFNKIKHCRRIATRWDKLAANFLAFVQLASIRFWLRV